MDGTVALCQARSMCAIWPEDLKNSTVTDGLGPHRPLKTIWCQTAVWREKCPQTLTHIVVGHLVSNQVTPTQTLLPSWQPVYALEMLGVYWKCPHVLWYTARSGTRLQFTHVAAIHSTVCITSGKNEAQRLRLLFISFFYVLGYLFHQQRGS